MIERKISHKILDDLVDRGVIQSYSYIEIGRSDDHLRGLREYEKLILTFNDETSVSFTTALEKLLENTLLIIREEGQKIESDFEEKVD